MSVRSAYHVHDLRGVACNNCKGRIGRCIACPSEKPKLVCRGPELVCEDCTLRHEREAREKAQEQEHERVAAGIRALYLAGVTL